MDYGIDAESGKHEAVGAIVRSEIFCGQLVNIVKMLWNLRHREEKKEIYF